MFAQPINLFRSFCKASCPSKSTAPPSLMSLTNLLMVHPDHWWKSWTELALDWALRNTTGDQLPARCSTFHCSPFSPAIQQVLHLVHHKSACLTAEQWVQKGCCKGQHQMSYYDPSTFPSSIRWMTLSEKDVKLVRTFPLWNQVDCACPLNAFQYCPLTWLI